MRTAILFLIIAIFRAMLSKNLNSCKLRLCRSINYGAVHCKRSFDENDIIATLLDRILCECQQ